MGTAAILGSLTRVTPQPPSAGRNDLPVDIDQVVGKALAKDLATPS